MPYVHSMLKNCSWPQKTTVVLLLYTAKITKRLIQSSKSSRTNKHSHFTSIASLCSSGCKTQITSGEGREIEELVLSQSQPISRGKTSWMWTAEQGRFGKHINDLLLLQLLLKLHKFVTSAVSGIHELYNLNVKIMLGFCDPLWCWGTFKCLHLDLGTMIDGLNNEISNKSFGCIWIALPQILTFTLEQI